MFLETQEVIAKIEDLLLKYGSEKSQMIAVASYLMEIALNPVMNEKWGAWPGDLKRPNRPSISNVITEKQVLEKITVTATK